MEKETIDPKIMARLERRVAEIIEAMLQRAEKGQSLSLELEFRFCVTDLGAVQFQLASVILQELEGLNEQEVIGELLGIGLQTVLLRGVRVATESKALPLLEEVSQRVACAASSFDSERTLN